MKCVAMSPDNQICSNSGAFHMGTETGFTRSGSPICFQFGLVWASHGTQTTRIALLDWISRTVTRSCTTQLGSGSRPCGSKVVFGSGSPIRIASGSKVPCVEPHYLSWNVPKKHAFASACILHTTF